MRAIVVVFATLSLSAGLGLAEDLEALKAAVVKLRAKTEDQSARTGTGFIISLTKDHAIILTATHVIEGDSAPTVEFYGNQMAPASAKAGKQHSGLALLTVPRDRLPADARALALSAEKLAETTEVKVIGFPMGGAPWSVVRASISAPDGLDLTLDGTIREGNSGGPVLYGDAVVAMVTQTTDFARAIPTSIILQLFTNWRISYTPAGKREPEELPSSVAVPKPEPCLQGYVWREAFPGDYVCVEPPVRSQAGLDNSQANQRRQPGGGAYGPDTCIQGYVWREASAEDRVCVKPETRDQARKDNQQASTRVQRAKSTIKDLRIRRESIIKPR